MLASFKSILEPQNWHFKFSLAKQYVLTRGTNSKMEQLEENLPTYYSDLCKGKSVEQWGKHITNLCTEIINVRLPLNQKKVSNEKLLQSNLVHDGKLVLLQLTVPWWHFDRKLFY